MPAAKVTAQVVGTAKAVSLAPELGRMATFSWLVRMTVARRSLRA